MARGRAKGSGDTYDPGVAASICDYIAEGMSLRAVCQRDDMPIAGTVCNWLTNHPDFAERYARAREVQCELLAAEIIDISNTPQIGTKTKETEKGVEVSTGDMIEHRRLQVDARKWYLSKVLPKRYGDRLELAGDKANPIAVDSTLTVRFVDAGEKAE